MSGMAKAIRRLLSSAGAWRALVTVFIGLLAFSAAATNHILRQDEIMVGLNGDGRIQFVEITVTFRFGAFFRICIDVRDGSSVTSDYDRIVMKRDGPGKI
jgi:hypothetical protein